MKRYNGSDKLAPHLYKHEKYVIHYRNLKCRHQLGVNISKLHRVMSFVQSDWLKQFTDINIKHQEKAKNYYGATDGIKLMNSAVFGNK